MFELRAIIGSLSNDDDNGSENTASEWIYSVPNLTAPI